ncbi:MAG: hypothetical protein K2Y21_11725 [Phycisphaerales bacterium]|nr:hypothetical protein [Phycisphaerales bacterium]
MIDLDRKIEVDHVWLSLICEGGAIFFSLLLQSNTGPAIAVCHVMAGWCNYRGIIRPGRTRVDLVANLLVLSLVIVQLVALVTWHVMRW